jgi:hypothetical protein
MWKFLLKALIFVILCVGGYIAWWTSLLWIPLLPPEAQDLLGSQSTPQVGVTVSPETYESPTPPSGELPPTNTDPAPRNPLKLPGITRPDPEPLEFTINRPPSDLIAKATRQIDRQILAEQRVNNLNAKQPVEGRQILGLI